MSVIMRNIGLLEFDTVAAMKANPVEVGQSVRTKGYTTAGDGGGATYLVEASGSADEFGDHELANGNVARLQGVTANLKSFGMTGDGVTDDSAGLSAALVWAAGKKAELVGNGSFYIPTTVINLSPESIKISAAGGQGAQGEVRGALEFITDTANPILIMGDSSNTSWGGPTLTGVGFRDTGGISTAGLIIRRLNSWTITDFYADGFVSGDGLQLDGGADSTQYGILINPRIHNTKRAIHKIGNVEDITIVGGRLFGAIPHIPDSAGITESDGGFGFGSGRWSIYGLGINNFITGINIESLRVSYIRATIEQTLTNKNVVGTIGIKAGGTGVPDLGWRNHLDAHIIGHDVGVSVLAGARHTAITCTFSQNTTNISDAGDVTVIGSQASDQYQETLGLLYGFRNQAAISKQIGFNHKILSNSVAAPHLLLPGDEGTTVGDGGYVGSENDNRFTVGCGIYGSPEEPRAAASTGFFAFYNGTNNSVTFHSFSGASVGDVITRAGSEVGRIDNTGLWLTDGVSTPGVRAGFAAIYVDTADGNLKIMFGDGTVKTIVTNP